MAVLSDSVTQNIEKTHSYWTQVFSVFGVTYLCISCGNFLGYTSSAIPSMKEDSDTFGEISPHDISWIGGLAPLGALTGSLFTLVPLPKLGSRRTIFYIGSPILILSWIVIGFATSVYVIFVGRFLGGFGSGVVISCSPLYVLEVSSVCNRGRLGVLPQFLMLLGIFNSYVLGSFLGWKWLAVVGAAAAVPSVILLAIASDSPTWLVSKGRDEEALRFLQDLHGSKEAARQLREVQAFVEVSNEKTVRKRRVSLEIMIKTSAVALGILSFQQLSGINAVTFYAVTIFKEASSDGTINAHVPSIILASTQLCASFTATLFIEKFGRKILLMVSSVLMATSTCSLGIYFYYASQSQLSHFHWIPLVTLIIFAFGFAIGFGPVSWILIAEVLPHEIRHIMNPLALSYSWFCVFLVTKSFPLLSLEINIYGVFWMYAIIAALGGVFVHFCIPETKGKTPQQIMTFFVKNANASQGCHDLEQFEVLHICDTNNDDKN